MDPSAQLFQLEWKPSGEELVATVALPNGSVEVRVGSRTEQIQPAPGVEMVDVQRWAFALLRNGYRLSSGQGTGTNQAGIFRAAYKAVLRLAAMESSVGTCPSCQEHTYPQQLPDKNGREGYVTATFDETMPGVVDILEKTGFVKDEAGWHGLRKVLAAIRQREGDANLISFATSVVDDDDRIVCPSCNNDQNKRMSCTGCYTIGYLYRPNVAGDLRCIDKACRRGA